VVDAEDEPDRAIAMPAIAAMNAPPAATATVRRVRAFSSRAVSFRGGGATGAGSDARVAAVFGSGA